MIAAMGGCLVPIAISAKLGLDLVVGQESGVIVLFRDDADGPEVLDVCGGSEEVAQVLRGPAGHCLARLVARIGSPLHFQADELPDEAVELRAVLYNSICSSMIVFPLFGEHGVVGYSAVQCEEPILECGDQRWRAASRGFQRLQLAAACGALDAQLEHDRRRPGELCDGLLAVDSDGRIVFSDGMADELSGWRHADVLGRQMGDVPCAHQLRAVSDRVSDALEWHEVVLSCSGGSDVPAEIAAAALPSGHGAPEGRIYFVRDLRSQAPSELDGTGRMLALGMRVAHSADVLGHALGLGPDGQSRPGTADDLEPTFGRTIREARRLVAAVLERCVPQEDRGMVNLNELIEDVLGRSRSQLDVERIRAFSLLKAEVPLVPGDRLELLGVVSALVQSARAALSPKGGTLTTRTWADDTWVYMTVSDDGAGRGHAPDDFGRPLFDQPGRVVDAALDSVREVVSAWGGRVTIESRPDVWTRITIMIHQERRRAPRAEATEVVLPAESDAGGLCVLVVDDNAALRSVLRRYLERRGHAVMEACDGEEGLRVVRGRDFDRVIVDVQMPVKDGPGFYEDLREVRPDLQNRTIFMSGGFLTPEAEKVIGASGRPSVRKPFDLVEMAKAVEA